MRYVNMMSNEPQAVKQVSMNNLDLVVNFCENMMDCRRVLQLNYFGEHFTREQCLANRQSACDNCTRVLQYKVMDVTDIAKNIVATVADICSYHGLTVLQLVDIFKGAMTKRITDAKHQLCKGHGSLKNWERNDIQRILHKLVVENYLREEIKVFNDIPICYVKVGKNVAQLMSQNKKIEFAIAEKRFGAVTNKKTETQVIRTRSDEEFNDKISALRDRCYHDLMDIARSIADERNLTIQQVINMEALRQMSIQMPETEEDMLQIPHITNANYEKYGKKFLEVIIPYSAQQSAYEMDRAEEIANVNEAGDDVIHDSDNDYATSQDWEELGREALTSGTSKGFKRKSSANWGKSITKKYKRSKSGTKRKARSPAKRSTGSAAKKKVGKGLMPTPRPTF